MLSSRWFASHSLLVLGLVLRGPGCGDASSASSFQGDGKPAGITDDTPATGATSSFAEDAAAPKALYRGNPLCRIGDGRDGRGANSCSPDDDGVSRTRNTLACATAAPDPEAGAEDPSDVRGCRITRHDGEVAPTCSMATRDGTDGVACATGAECAPGFDCVEGASGSVCRRYCCMGTCDGQSSQNGGGTFCDVQKLVDANWIAPVCMPIKGCKLLTDGECADGETCAVVTENGEAGCVAVGEAQVGASCDAAHCAAGLTCLGQPGNRRCYQLCEVGGTTCKGGQTCQTSTVFKDAVYGVCQDPAP